jgi:O-antigen chain-terminating methyltransferase
MHLVEHLPIEVLIDLIDQSYRVLLPDGVIAFETPNPENVLVGSHYFYMDPTHRNPLPPTLLQWLVEARGFVETRVDRLTVNRGVTDIVPVTDDVPGARQINAFGALLQQPPDYAVIARKRVDRSA